MDGTGAKASPALDHDSFADVKLLRNHWSSPAGPRAYYWYLGFEGAPGVRALVARCQEAIAFPYYDLVLPQALHMTLGRVAAESELTAAQVNAIEVAAGHACREIPPFKITLGPLSGTRGAVGFDASPAETVNRLRTALWAATLAACPSLVMPQRDMVPHVTIAYANAEDVPAADVVAAVAGLNEAGARAETAVEEVMLVLLQRGDRGYAWERVSGVQLQGAS